MTARTGVRLLATLLLLSAAAVPAGADPVHTTYLWHMHQPIYWPDPSTWTPGEYETAYETITLGHSQSDVFDVFNKDDRVRDYQDYPRIALSTVLDLPDAGAQVSFASALAENLFSLGDNGWNGGRYAPDWYRWYREAAGWTTSGGRTRCDMVLVAAHHPIAPLMDENAFRMELKVAKALRSAMWGSAPATKGYFPAETCFSERLIPVLAGEGTEWAIVANTHLSRACADYPYAANEDNCDPPNPADQTNPAAGDWNSIYISRGVTVKTALPFGHQPHWARYVDPETGSESRLVVLPAANAMGWDEGYGLYGTGQIDAIAPYNDPSKPMLILFAHDGDNAWSGGYSYFNENVTSFCHGAATAGYEPTTIEEYLADHPVDSSDVARVEDGGWVNADGDFGSPQFINWNWPLVNSSGQFDIPNGWAEDERNWAVLTAAQNRVETAEAIQGAADPARVADPSTGANDAETAWHFLLAGYESGYMYYGVALDMEIKATLACNEATDRADAVIATGSDMVPPTIWLPQRLPWNPGGFGGGSLWGYPGGQGLAMDRDFHVWTFVHDVSGIDSVVLRYRIDGDGVNDPATDVNETYAGGAGVGAWTGLFMNRRVMPLGDPYNNPEIDFSVLPNYIADEYYVEVTGLSEQLVDYYVEATDSLGLVKRSPIQHVWVGSGSGSGGGDVATWSPEEPVAGETLQIIYDARPGALADDTDPVYIHIGHSCWQEVLSPDPAMTLLPGDTLWTYTYSIPSAATSVDFVFNDGAGGWDNNNGADWHVSVSGGGPSGFVMDGAVDAGATFLAEAGGTSLWVAHDAERLYVAATGASGLDRFLLIAAESAAVAAPWAKGGTVHGKEYFLARESTNGWHGWFDSGENVFSGESASGAVLEGTLLRSLLGGAETVRIAAALYGNADGGALSGQAPGAVQSNGDVEWNEYAVYSMTSTGVEGRPLPEEREEALFFAPPTPYRVGSAIRYRAPEAGRARVSVYDVRGRLVAVPLDEAIPAGEGACRWDGRDRFGRTSPSGVYLWRFEAAGRAASGKMVLIR
ncbi:MAG: hypothetical protein JW958_12215 [Candidatus Eisenbacteria bacterium]|nr:hypothetical protein [Candidatus Eisenbacteria bacterium]